MEETLTVEEDDNVEDCDTVNEDVTEAVVVVLGLGVEEIEAVTQFVEDVETVVDGLGVALTESVLDTDEVEDKLKLTEEDVLEDKETE